MQVYEEDIQTPIKSAIRGTLIRGILVQVQKAKVCLSLSLGGQELGILQTSFKIPSRYQSYILYKHVFTD